MENRINRPPHRNFDVDFLSGSSRERKSPALYQPGAFSESDLQYYTGKESHQRNTNFDSGAHIKDNTRGLGFNQAKSIDPTSLGDQFENHQFPTQNVSLGSWLNCNGNSNFHVNRTENLHNPSHVPRQPLEYEGLVSVVETTWQTQVVPGEAYKSLPFLKSDGAHTRRDQMASSIEEIVQNPVSLQNGVQFGSSGTSGVTVGNICENGEQVQGDGLVKIEQTKKASDMRNLMCPLPESSPKYFSPTSTVESGQKKDKTHVSPVSDEKCLSQLGKPASIVAEKLWDGSVRLSPSVVVSAVAFFKSGEKLLDTNWSESVEVKGKVRLEAFEKYIQDLPRSRNRGCMVISLCWKEGSSETGLTGMKEVAKGYQKGEKVGRAPLSPGIDLYICPRSDATIKILAKYGFFKGMTAVEDNPDSMIGCVVWRKNQTSSNFVAKKPESKSNSLSEKPLNFSSLSPLQQAAETEKCSPIAQPAQESAKRSLSEAKKQIEINNTVAGPDQPKTSLELQKPIMPFSSDKPNKTTSSSDDDDLPEFDFRTACGISQTNMTAKPSVSVLLDKRVPAERSRDTDMPFFPVTQNLLSVSVSAQRSDHSKLPSTVNEGMASLKKIYDHQPQIPVLSNVGETFSVIQNNVTTTPVSTTVFSHPKNIFDDDDDMPEWCPPERSLADTTNRSTTFPSELQNPPFQTLVRGPPRSVPFSPSPNATHPPFSSQGFPPKAPRPRPFKRVPFSSMQSDSGSILGPPPSFDSKIPFYQAEKRRRTR